VTSLGVVATRQGPGRPRERPTPQPAGWGIRAAGHPHAFTAKQGRTSRLSHNDVLFGYRLQVFERAARTSVSERVGPSAFTARPITAGSERSTATAEMLRPRERRRQAKPNVLPTMVEERIVAFDRP